MSDDLSPADTRRIQLARTVLDPVRMWIIERCESTDGEISIDQLSEELAAQATDSAHDDDIDSRRISLAHVHLPQLATLGLIEYDHERGTVASNDALDSLGEVIHTAHHFTDAIDSLLARGTTLPDHDRLLQDV